MLRLRRLSRHLPLRLALRNAPRPIALAFDSHTSRGGCSNQGPLCGADGLEVQRGGLGSGAPPLQDLQAASTCNPKVGDGPLALHSLQRVHPGAVSPSDSVREDPIRHASSLPIAASLAQRIDYAKRV